MDWLNNHLTLKDLMSVVAALSAGGFGLFKLSSRFEIGKHLRRILNIEPGVESLKEAMDNMSQIVYSQGQSIDWLTSQLTQYREELTEAREQLKEMEIMHQENLQLKIRVAELEAQVKALEEELARRKKYTPKDKRID